MIGIVGADSCNSPSELMERIDSAVHVRVERVIGLRRLLGGCTEDAIWEDMLLPNLEPQMIGCGVAAYTGLGTISPMQTFLPREYCQVQPLRKLVH